MKVNKSVEELLKEYESNEVIFIRGLDKKKYSPQKINYWRKQGCLKSVCHGIICAPDKDSINTERCIADFVRQFGYSIRISASSALALYGYKVPALQDNALVVSMGEHFNNVPEWVSSRMLNRPIYMFRTNLFPMPETKMIEHNGAKLPVSSLEEALMECIMLASTKCYHYDDVYTVFKQVDDLRANVVQRLLETMTNKKAKRMFLFMSENLDKPWFSKLNLEKIQLGKGVYAAAKRGRLVSKYHLIVPKSIYANGEFEKNPEKCGLKKRGRKKKEENND